ncbi:MAG TPA: type I 3-dehydroquinate dehydratase [Usitatibacter sp.]|nr:type I 3-dehydroquinate dehydratase [Usitatibacter sp.]
MGASKAILIRGRKLGGKTPLICAPLVAATATKLIDEARAVLKKKPDVIEWRVDYFEGITDTQAVVDAARKLRRTIGNTPLIFTRRSPREGGQPTTLDTAAVVRLYKAIGAKKVADVVDFEMRNEHSLVRRVVATAHRQGVRVILSYHNFKRTPGARTLRDRFLKAERLGADIAKVAVMPRNRSDVLALLAATARADAKSRIPLISMSMGPMGAITRIVGGLFGSTLTFAVGEGASAPGQLPIADLREVFALLDRTRKK